MKIEKFKIKEIRSDGTLKFKLFRQFFFFRFLGVFFLISQLHGIRENITERRLKFGFTLFPRM